MERDLNIYKIIVLGDNQVGKSTYIQGIIDNDHSPENHHYMIGIYFKRKNSYNK